MNSTKRKPDAPAKTTPGSPLVRKLTVIAILLIAANALLYYRNWRHQQALRLALEEKQRQEQAVRERQRRLLQEKQQEYQRLIEEMRALVARGLFGKAREVSEAALALARQYGFQTDEVDRLLYAIALSQARARLAYLERLSEDIFLYGYVRHELNSIPALGPLKARIHALRRATYDNEYLVCLHLSQRCAERGQAGDSFRENYHLSKQYLARGILLRQQYRLTPRDDRERDIAERQNRLFFAFRPLQAPSEPRGIY